MNNLALQISQYDFLYWEKNKQKISDYEYDLLCAKIGTRDSSYECSFFRLQKCYDREFIKNNLSEYNFYSPKADGCFLQIEYGLDKKLKKIITRGKIDVTQKLKHLFKKISEIAGLKIRAELVLQKKFYAGELRKKYPQPRHVAACFLRNKKVTKKDLNKLLVVGWEVVFPKVLNFEEEKKILLKYCDRCDIKKVVDYNIILNTTINSVDYFCDGIVFCSNKKRMERNRKIYSHWRLAFKFAEENYGG